MINRITAAFGLSLVILAHALPARADDLPSAQVTVLDARPSLDGTIDASWSKATAIALDYDFTYKRKAAEPTRVLVAQDGDFLDVAFIATQKSAPIAASETNSPSVEGDDFVAVYLAPQGTSGIEYSFLSNPRGARFQTSSENTAYSPQWTAIGEVTPTGYAVTMRIPLDIIRSGGSSSWRAQFARMTLAGNSLSVWSFDPRAQSQSDPTFSGTLLGMNASSKATRGQRPKPRLGAYGLSESTSKPNGGSTSRIGADFAIPFAPTASFFGTLHPDYSNVEVDQQTIAPNAFARQYAEVRPFFTQAASYYNSNISCSNCPQALYTPAIPTFGQGYGIEGTQGHLTYAAFDSIGNGRDDDAQSLNYNYNNPNSTFGIYAQRVQATYDGVSDVTSTFNTGYVDTRSHFTAYLNLGWDRGSNVTDPGLGNYFESGFGYIDPTTLLIVNLQAIGAQFNPVDGYVPQTDIDGYEWYNSKTLNFSPSASVHDINGQFFYARYDNRFGQVAQTHASGLISVDFKDLVTVHAFAYADGIRAFDGAFLPFQQDGFMVAYRLNTPTPTSISYTGGKYYHGNLNSWTYLATLPLSRKIHLSLETDENQYGTSWPGEQTTRQWLERAGLDWQFNRFASFDAGVRRIIGPNIPNSFEPLAENAPAICSANPYNPGCYVNASNVTLAFHYLRAQNEFYIVYGDANNLATEPALFLKWIRYIGAEKGT